MEPGIYVETKPAALASDFPGFTRGLFNKRHAYLVNRRSDGSTEVIRGGYNGQGKPVTVETGKTLDDSDDHYKDDEAPGSRPSKKLDIPPGRVEQSWATMKQRAEDIGAAKIPYADDLSDGDADKTSNSVVRGSLDAIDYPVEKALPDGEKMDDLPGIEDDYQGLMEEMEEINREREKLERESEEYEYDNPIDSEDDWDSDDNASDFSTKPVEQWSESDARAAHAEAVSLSPYIPSAMALRKKVGRWYEITFGDDPVKLDDTGRMIDPGPHKLPATNSDGQVHVSAYRRQQDGRSVSVGSHTRSRPR